MLNVPSLTLLPGVLESILSEALKVPSIDKIKLFNNSLFWKIFACVQGNDLH